jgi:tetratricopeptide (TPR) repeat protein
MLFKFASSIFQSAYKYLTKSTNHKNALQAFQIGYAYYENNKDDEALIYFDKAIELGYLNAIKDRAWCLHSLGYQYDAINDFSKSIQLDSNDSNQYYGRALCYVQIGNINAAVLDMEQAVIKSRVENIYNLKYDRNAKNMGYNNATELYLFQYKYHKDILTRLTDPNSFDSKYYNSKKEEVKPLRNLN